MVKVGIIGALGYGAREMIRLLAAHLEAELVAAVGREGGIRLDAMLPAFRGIVDLELETFDASSLAKRCDAVFMGLPGGESMQFGAALHEAGVRIFDLGSDFRLKDAALYEQYYKKTYSHPELVEKAVYGHVPFYRKHLKDAEIVAVPGCFPISVITALKPLMAAADPQVPVVINSVSGVSGAGKGLNDVFHFPNMNENVKAYKLAIHQHVPEIEQELGGGYQVQFTPHVAPVTRGICSTICLRPSTDIDVAALYACYDNEPFVRVLGEGNIPDLNHVRGSNFCDIGWVTDERTGNLMIVSVIDNLIGGTSGMGLQCLNVAFGLEETMGLQLPGMAP